MCDGSGHGAVRQRTSARLALVPEDVPAILAAFITEPRHAEPDLDAIANSANASTSPSRSASNPQGAILARLKPSTATRSTVDAGLVQDGQRGRRVGHTRGPLASQCVSRRGENEWHRFRGGGHATFRGAVSRSRQHGRHAARVLAGGSAASSSAHACRSCSRGLRHGRRSRSFVRDGAARRPRGQTRRNRDRAALGVCRTGVGQTPYGSPPRLAAHQESVSPHVTCACPRAVIP